MAVNAEQLPSGSWRCRVYDPITKKYKSFTTKVKGKRGKQLIEAEANAWAASRKPKPIQEKPLRYQISVSSSEEDPPGVFLGTC